MAFALTFALNTVSKYKEMHNMQNSRNDLWQKTSFSTCSYIKSLRDYRALIVRRAIQSWAKVLELPFAEKIFLDDSSPDLNGIKLLQSSNQINRFDCVRYNTMSHPPHSNFGIIISLSKWAKKFTAM